MFALVLFFSCCSFWLGMCQNCVFQYMTGVGVCRENESSVYRAGPVGSVCWKSDHMSVSFNALHTRACFALPAGKIKEERWVGLSLFLHCLEMLVLAYRRDKTDLMIIFPCCFKKMVSTEVALVFNREKGWWKLRCFRHNGSLILK